MNRDDLERMSKAALVELVLRLQRPAKSKRPDIGLATLVDFSCLL
jgi:hypothetical protein